MSKAKFIRSGTQCAGFVGWEMRESNLPVFARKSALFHRLQHHLRPKIKPHFRLADSCLLRQFAPFAHAKSAFDGKQSVVAKMFRKISCVQNDPKQTVEENIAMNVI